jgi:hypothetical protein
LNMRSRTNTPAVGCALDGNKLEKTRILGLLFGTVLGGH